MVINERSIFIISIIGLGAALTCSIIRNKKLKRFTSEEKMSLFRVCTELGLDNLNLQKKIDELESKQKEA